MPTYEKLSRSTETQPTYKEEVDRVAGFISKACNMAGVFPAGHLPI